MNLNRSAKLTPKLIWVDNTGSTNTDLVSMAGATDLPEFTVLATANQTSGRGRSGRVWQAPAGASLAISVLLKPDPKAPESLGWLPLLAGLAMAQNVGTLLPNTKVGVKWPNDVLVAEVKGVEQGAERKISGVLTELVPRPVAGATFAVVVGAGINVTLAHQDLPVPTATSLQLSGAMLGEDETERLDLVLSGYLERLWHHYSRFRDSGFDAEASGLRNVIKDNCVSLNREVRAVLPGDSEKVGWATDIDADGRLKLQVLGQSFAMAAGDIVHLRHN